MGNVRLQCFASFVLRGCFARGLIFTSMLRVRQAWLSVPKRNPENSHRAPPLSTSPFLLLSVHLHSFHRCPWPGNDPTLLAWLLSSSLLPHLCLVPHPSHAPLQSPRPSQALRDDQCTTLLSGFTWKARFFRHAVLDLNQLPTTVLNCYPPRFGSAPNLTCVF